MFDFLYRALGALMKMIYDLVNNYGWAIILFTVITKVILFPLSLKQQKSAAQMQKVKPLLDDIQKKYANNREKMAEETMKLYQEYGISPTGGCLPLLIQLPIIFALYNVIRRPYTYILGWGKEEFAEKGIKLTKAVENNEIAEVAKKVKEGLINFDFFGLDMSKTPDFKHFSALWIIPVVAAVLTFLQSKFMYIGLSKEEVELRKGKKANNANSNGRPPRPGEKKDNSAEQMTTSMTYFMPVMTLMFTFSLPAGIGLYWIAGSVVQIALTYVSNKYIIPNMKVKKKGGNANDIEEVRKMLREKRKDS